MKAMPLPMMVLDACDTLEMECSDENERYGALVKMSVIPGLAHQLPYNAMNRTRCLGEL